MKKCFKKVVLLLVGMLTRDGIAMEHLRELVVPKQMILVPKEQGALWTKYKDTWGGYEYYPQDSFFCTWEEVEPELNSARDRIRKHEDEQAQNLLILAQRYPGKQLCYYSSHRSFPANTFLSLVTAPTLNNKELIDNNKNYFGVNGRDDKEFTPLHILTVRPDATLPMLIALLERGANPLSRTNIICKNGRNEVGDYPCECAVEYRGQSPSHKSVGGFFEGQCAGNKDIIKYIWPVTLCARITELKKEEEKKAKIAEYKKAVKYKGVSPANEHIGKFFEKQCDAEKIKKLFSGVLVAKLEKLYDEQREGRIMQKRQKKLQKEQYRLEMAEKKRAWAQGLTI